MQRRNEHGSNGLLELGGGYDEPNRGKGVVKNSKATKCAQKSDYFPLSKNKPLPAPSYQDEFKSYNQEDIDRSNDLDEKTLTKEAVEFLKQNSPSVKGIMSSLQAKKKTDRKYFHYNNFVANFLKRIIEAGGISQSRI